MTAPPRTDPPGSAGTRLELEIDKVGTGGVCVARHEGQVVFVRHTLPGERVVAVVREGKPGDSYLRADAVEILRASPDRVPEPCPYAGPGKCGGCDWQHVALPAQRELKARVVEEQLQRLAGLELAVTVEPVADPQGVDDGLNWRTRMQFAVDSQGRLGLRKSRSHQLQLIGDEGPCRIAHPDIDALDPYDRRWNAISEVDIAVSGNQGSDGERIVIATSDRAEGRVRLPPLGNSTGIQLRREPADASPRGRNRRHRAAAPLERVSGRTWLGMPALGRTWRVSAGSFWQVHPGAADTLATAVIEALKPRAGETALDLYAGVGLFAGALAPLLGAEGSMTMVEGDARAVADARRNLHDLTNVAILEQPVEMALGNLGAPGEPGDPIEPVDLVVLDPPRSGAGAKVVAGVVARRPRAVAYVACDPASLARDVATFAEVGYRLGSLRAFDLFPMTAHVECLALLTPVGPEA